MNRTMFPRALLFALVLLATSGGAGAFAQVGATPDTMNKLSFEALTATPPRAEPARPRYAPDPGEDRATRSGRHGMARRHDRAVRRSGRAGAHGHAPARRRHR